MNKDEARARVWAELIKVARPDSRYHFDFQEFIPDFAGSEAATTRLTALDIYQTAGKLFITPDNCLEALRAQAVVDNKTQVVSTYGIRRGFYALAPADVPAGLEQYAVLLDGLERLARPLTLSELQADYRPDLLVTGASAVNCDGVRFGKGHGFFDLEWAIFYELGLVDQHTPIVAFVHDCQLVDVPLALSPFDTLCDYIVTPTQTIQIPQPQKPTAGVIWDKLAPGMMEAIPALAELRAMLTFN
ncbi:MAG: 5-formyltetrahydrofolate cyclo-ligase [Ardenticatenales bacterium]|nr:5-formyltetrahydrofolate cyclo-ligase [Ardenticatenales bacterium]